MPSLLLGDVIARAPRSGATFPRTRIATSQVAPGQEAPAAGAQYAQDTTIACFKLTKIVVAAAVLLQTAAAV